MVEKTWLQRAGENGKTEVNKLARRFLTLAGQANENNRWTRFYAIIFAVVLPGFAPSIQTERENNTGIFEKKKKHLRRLTSFPRLHCDRRGPLVYKSCIGTVRFTPFSINGRNTHSINIDITERSWSKYYSTVIVRLYSGRLCYAATVIIVSTHLFSSIESTISKVATRPNGVALFRHSRIPSSLQRSVTRPRLQS